MQQMHVYGVSFDLVGKQPIVLLKTIEGNRFLPIWIGHAEAAAILMKLQNAATPRPMTHDLVTDILGELGAKVTQVAVTELRENTFYAQLTIQQDGSEVEIDSRPSDAIALAVRADAPIFVADEVIDESAIEFEGEEISDEALEKEVTKFRSFLENVTPDEFAGAGGRGLGNLALRQVEHLRVELAQPFGRQRAAVRALQVVEHPLLAFRIDEADSVRLLVALQPRDELESLVECVDELAVVVRDRLAKLADEWIGLAQGLPSQWTWTCLPCVGSTMRRYGYVTLACPGFVSVGVRSRTVTTTRPRSSTTRAMSSRYAVLDAWAAGDQHRRLVRVPGGEDTQQRADRRRSRAALRSRRGNAAAAGRRVATGGRTRPRRRRARRARRVRQLLRIDGSCHEHRR